jgi:hypothetical protein
MDAGSQVKSSVRRTREAHMKAEMLGEADLRIAGLRLWVHGRQFPDSHDICDGNWLNVTAECRGAGSRVEVEGSIVNLEEIAALLVGCEHLQSSLSGEASLGCIEPNMSVELKMADRLGHLAVKIRLTADHMNESHEFQDEIDQSYLPSIIAACCHILEKYPVRGRKGA